MASTRNLSSPTKRQLAQTVALAKLLIEKRVITKQELLETIAEERAAYQRLLKVMEN